jgi:hypothetical protein
VRAGRKPPEALAGPEIPEPVAYLWEWFAELNAARRWSQVGPEPIGYAELAAWAALTDRHPLPHEVEALMTLDLVTRSVSAEGRKDG